MQLTIRNVEMSDASSYTCETMDGKKKTGYLQVNDPRDFAMPRVSIFREKIPAMFGGKVSIVCDIGFSGQVDVYWTFPNGSKVIEGLAIKSNLSFFFE